MTRPRLYFAHPINTYDTELERRALNDIALALPGWVIENPNRPEHQEGYQRYKAMEGKIGMDYFTEEVLPSCSGGVALPFRNGKFGAGIWKEMDWFGHHGCPMWELDLTAGVLILPNIPPGRRLTVEETRALIRFPDGSRKPY